MNETDLDFSDHQDANLFGPPEEVRDADGLRFYEYDWRGLVTKASHRFWDVDWTNSSASVWTGGSSWDPEVDDTARGSVSSWLTLTALDDTTTMELTTTYDAAGRPLVTTYPSLHTLGLGLGAGALVEQFLHLAQGPDLVPSGLQRHTIPGEAELDCISQDSGGGRDSARALRVPRQHLPLPHGRGRVPAPRRRGGC